MLSKIEEHAKSQKPDKKGKEKLVIIEATMFDMTDEDSFQLSIPSLSSLSVLTVII